MDSATTRFTNAEWLFLSGHKWNSTDDQYQDEMTVINRKKTETTTRTKKN